MAVSDLDLDIKLEGDRIMASNEGAIFYARIDEDRQVSYSYAGDVADIARLIMSAMADDEDGILYEILTAAIGSFEETSETISEN